jgi:hypothetical protein
MNLFRSIFTLLFLFLSISIFAQNPISPPGVYIADPEAHQWDDGKLYIYGSVDQNTKDWCSHTYHILSTFDLLTWDLDKNVFSSKGEFDQVSYSDKHLYAPDCMLKDSTYYLYYCLSGGGEDEGVATSKSPYGPFTNGKIIKGISQIDPAVFIDDDGQAYLFWGQASLKGAKLKPNMMEVDTSTIKHDLLEQKKDFFHEGASIRKINETYYVAYAHEGRRNRPTCIGYATSDSPLGPYTYRGVIIDNYGCDPEVWNNHGSIAQYNGQWYVFYHRSTHASQKMRKACMEPIKINPNGSIPEVEMTSQGAGGPLNAFARIEAERACTLSGNVRVQAMDEANEELGKIESGNTAAFKYLDFAKGATEFITKLSGKSKGGTIEIYIDSLATQPIGTCTIPENDGSKAFSITQCVVKKITGVHALYFKFMGDGQEGSLCNMDWFSFK